CSLRCCGWNELVAILQNASFRREGKRRQAHRIRHVLGDRARQGEQAARRCEFRAARTTGRASRWKGRSLVLDHYREEEAPRMVSRGSRSSSEAACREENSSPRRGTVASARSATCQRPHRARQSIGKDCSTSADMIAANIDYDLSS